MSELNLVRMRIWSLSLGSCWESRSVMIRAFFFPISDVLLSHKPRMERRLWMTCRFIAQRLASPGGIMSIGNIRQHPFLLINNIMKYYVILFPFLCLASSITNLATGEFPCACKTGAKPVFRICKGNKGEG